jgi:hypothetical protein
MKVSLVLILHDANNCRESLGIQRYVRPVSKTWGSGDKVLDSAAAMELVHRYSKLLAGCYYLI